MLEVEPTGQRSRAATRSGRNGLDTEKIFVVNISKTKRDRAMVRLLLNTNRKS